MGAFKNYEIGSPSTGIFTAIQWIYFKKIFSVSSENISEICLNKIPILKSLLCMSIWNFHMRGFIIKKLVVRSRLFAIKT